MDASGWVALMRKAEGGGMGSRISVGGWILLPRNSGVMPADRSMVYHSMFASC